MKTNLLCLSALLLVTGCAHGAFGDFIQTAKQKYGTYRYGSLSDAIKRGDIESVKTLISLGADMNKVDDSQMAPMDWAAENGNVEAVRAMIKAGWKNKNPIRSLIYTHAPLHLTNNAEIAEMLINAGEKPDQPNIIGETPLHKANVEVARVLIKAGANLNETDEDGFTPLHQAVLDNRIDVVKELLQAGANPTIKNPSGETPIEYAQTDEMKELLRDTTAK